MDIDHLVTNLNVTKCLAWFEGLSSLDGAEMRGARDGRERATAGRTNSIPVIMLHGNAQVANGTLRLG
jgi:hypothetical protein